MNEDFVSYDLAIKLKEKGFKEKCVAFYHMDNQEVGLMQGQIRITNQLIVRLEDVCTQFNLSNDDRFFDAPTIDQVLKWFREEKNIDIEIHAEVGILGHKVYIPYISTYTEFTLETSPEIVRYRQKKFNTITPLKHEIIPASEYFEEWEEAALKGIEYAIDNLI